jgi:hypothetical protein
MGEELKRCPFCGEPEKIGIQVMPEVFIDIYPNDEADEKVKAVQITAICQCRNCFAQVEDWARLLVPYALYQDTEISTIQNGEYKKFIGEAQDKARAMARLAWNRRA